MPSTWTRWLPVSSLVTAATGPFAARTSSPLRCRNLRDDHVPAVPPWCLRSAQPSYGHRPTDAPADTLAASENDTGVGTTPTLPTDPLKKVEMSAESTVRGRELGRRLLAAQVRAGYNGSELARRLQSTPSTISRTMSGRRTVDELEVATILGVCGVVGHERDELLALCRPHQDSALRLAVDQAWDVYLAQAAEAAWLVEFQLTMMPWLAQTPEYTHGLFADTLECDALLAHIDARRQTVPLLRTPRIEVLLHEWALRTPVVDAATMSDQLHHLIRISVRPNVSLRIVPAGRSVNATRHGPFTLLHFDDYAPVLYREDPSSGLLTDHTPDVDAYRSEERTLRAATLNEEESRALITKIAIHEYGASESLAAEK